MNAQTDEAGILAGAYLSMARIFSYPNSDTWQRLAEQGIVDPTLSQETLEADYLAAFELGRGKPAVPLFEGMHRGELGREGILEDLLRFYEFFDVKLSEADREYPDHLVTELEFLAWLCQQEHAARLDGRDTEPFVRAARDFLDRHLGAWLPTFCRRLEAADTAYTQFGAMLQDLVAVHRNRVGEQIQDSGETR